MAPFERLEVPSLAQIEAADDNGDLDEGVLRVTFCSVPQATKAGYQPPFSGVHFDPKLPQIVQFPNEILKNILDYLEPIWLFQAVVAFPEINRDCPNLVWYNALPPALFLEPEYFQDETSVHDKINMLWACAGGVGVESYVPIFDAAGVHPLNQTSYCFKELNTENNLISIPEVLQLSNLANQVEFDHSAKHPTDRTYYPCLPDRNRLLALGGPYRSEIDYKRELAGHFHYGKRCSICMELLDAEHRPYITEWDMRLCKYCEREYTLSPVQIQMIPGLKKLMVAERKNTNSLWAARHRLSYQPQWKPLVDDVLRRAVGLDYDTSMALQTYIEQMIETLKMSKKRKGQEVERRKIRVDIVAIAEKMWESGIGDDDRKERIAKFRRTSAPTKDLAKFLFPSRALDETKMFHPYEKNDFFLKDPTLELKTAPQFLSATDEWKRQQALIMITKLSDWDSHTYNNNGFGARVSTWQRAAVQYHVRRVAKSLSHIDRILHEFSVDPAQGALGLYGSSDKADSSLEIISQKLGLQRESFPYLPQLNEHDKILAKRAFTKIVLQACITCPEKKWTAPRGIEKLIDHLRVHHCRRFWSGDWTIRG